MYIDLFFTILIIICASIIIKNKKNINSLLLRIKKHKVWIVIIAIVLSYSAMLIDTSSVMREVRDAFLWKTDPAETSGRLINVYNDVTYWDKENLGRVHLLLVRLSAWHNFKDGYIWAWYCYTAYDTEGELITGSMWVPTKWEIHKENGKWQITDIFEAP